MFKIDWRESKTIRGNEWVLKHDAEWRIRFLQILVIGITVGNILASTSRFWFN